MLLSWPGHPLIAVLSDTAWPVRKRIMCLCGRDNCHKVSPRIKCIAPPRQLNSIIHAHQRLPVCLSVGLVAFCAMLTPTACLSCIKSNRCYRWLATAKSDPYSQTPRLWLSASLRLSAVGLLAILAKNITACAVATSSCISDVPSQWEGQNFDPHCSHIFQAILMKLKTKKDIRDTTPHAKFG